MKKGTLVAFALALAALVSDGILDYWSTVRLVDSNNRVVQTQETLTQIEAVFTSVEDAETSARGRVLTRKQLPNRSPIGTRAEADQGLRRLDELLVDNPNQRERLKALKELVDARFDHLAKVNDALEKQDFEAATARAAAGASRGQGMGAIRTLVQAMQAEERHKLAADLANARTSAYTATAASLTTSILAILFLGLLLVVIRRDLAVRQRATQLVQREREQLRVTLLSIGDGVIVTDARGQVTILNEVAATLTGCPVAVAVGRQVENIYRVLNEKSRQPVESAVVRALHEDGGPGLLNPLLLPGPQGSERLVEESAAAIRDEQGAIRGAVLVFRDVTELREADRRKDEFLAMLGHELRNPLAPLRNALHILQVQGPQAPLPALRDMMERQVRQMTRLVDDLLDVARITRGKIELQKEAVELNASVARSIEPARALLTARGHELTVTLPQEPVLLEADPTRLEQVLTNLLNNAAKYTPPGGHIWLTVEEDGAEAVVRVRDNGIGIRPELLPRLFEMFTQGDRVPNQVQEGLGIGLMLVRRLVELHGGTVRASSAGPGQGSEFVVRLPRLPADTPPDDGPSRSPTDYVCRPLRILVVEDNLDSAETMALLLRLWEHEVQIVHDGPRALAVADDFRPDVVLLDIGLPHGMDGYEVGRRLRQRPELAGCVLAALTGFGQAEDRQRSRDAGFDTHLVKPVDADTLRELLAGVQGEAPLQAQH